MVLARSRLVESGNGSLTLGSRNTYTGGTTVVAGTLISTAPESLGTGAITAASNGATVQVAPAADTVTGFGTNGAGWTLNANASVTTNVLAITGTTTNEARSAWLNQRVSTSAFNASFTYNNPNTATLGADGFAFVLQSDPRQVGARGGSAGGLGYSGITSSIAVGIDIFRSVSGGRGAKILTNGSVATPFATANGVAFGNGTPIDVSISYDGVLFSVTYTQGANSFTQTLSINLVTAIGSTAYIGFTGGTGGEAVTQSISNFTYTATGTVPATYVNNVIADGAATSLQVLATANTSTITMGTLSLTVGNNTLNVSAAAGTPANADYGLAFGQTTFSSTDILNVANNGTGTGTATLGALNDAGAAATLNVNGPGTTVLTSAATSIVNGTAVNVAGNGTLQSNNATALGTLAAVDLAAGTTLAVGASQTLGILTGAGSTVLNGNALTVGSTNNLSGTFSGVISDGSAAGSLIKNGTGTLTLSGTNTYTGTTTVNAGTLLVNGSIANGPAATDVIVNSTGTLGGSGTILGAVSVLSGGTVAPGNSPGILNVGKHACSLRGRTSRSKLNGTTPGNTATDHDQLNVTGAVNLGGATLSTSGALSVTPGTLQSIVIINNDGSDAVVGQFAGLTEGSAISFGGSQLFISYQGGDGNDVVLYSQPIVNGTAAGDVLIFNATATGYTYQLNSDPAD